MGGRVGERDGKAATEDSRLIPQAHINILYLTFSVWYLETGVTMRSRPRRPPTIRASASGIAAMHYRRRPAVRANQVQPHDP